MPRGDTYYNRNPRQGYVSAPATGPMRPTPSTAQALPTLPPPAQAPASPPATVTAQTYAPLEALLKRYDTHVGNLEEGTGRIMDIAGTRLRDAREGGRRALMQSQGFRGVDSSPATARYEADTQRGVRGALADIATGREATLTAALQGGLPIAQAPAMFALQEKGLGLDVARLQQQQSMDNFNRFLALLNAQRSSPIYTGTY